MPFLTTAMLVNMVQSQFGRVATTAPTSYKFGVVTSAPQDDTGLGLLEPVDPAYARLTVANNTTSFVVDSAPTLAVTNGLELTFPTATVNWGSVLGIAVYGSASTPNYLGYVEFTNPLSVSAGDTLVVPARGLRLNLDLTPVSAFVQEQSEMFIITSPNGTRYALNVSNTGTLSAVNAGAIVGPPAPPTSFAYNAGTRTFTWVAPPAVVTNAPLTSYTLWRSKDGDGEFTILDNDALSYVLPAGESGVFYLTADNPAGSSVPTSVVTVA